MSNQHEEMMPNAMLLDEEYMDGDGDDDSSASSDISLGAGSDEEGEDDDTNNYVAAGTFASSDISLGLGDDMNEDEDDLMSTGEAEDAEDADAYDDSSTIPSREEDDDEVQDIDFTGMDSSNNGEDEGNSGYSSSNNNNDRETSEGGRDDSCAYEDSLSLTMETTNHGTILVEAKGQVSLQRVGHLTILSRLQTTLSLPFVTNLLLLSDAECVKHLRFSQVSFKGSMQDYEHFAAALCRLYNLEELHMVDCYLLHNSGARPLDTILFGLSKLAGTLPKLRHVELYAVDIDIEPVGSSLGPTALAGLVRSKPSLTKLSLEDLTLGAEHVVELAKAMEDHKCLKELKLWCCSVEDKGMVAMAKMLKKNSCVEKLEFSYNEIGEVGCVAVAEALHRNNTLKELFLVENKKIVCGGEGYEALLKMMERNHTIQELLLEPTTEVDSDFCFYLFVNRHRFLLENDNITKRQLVDVLHSRRSDRNFLYLFLKAKPTLCDCS